MKPDPTYTKALLDAFEASPNHIVELTELEAAGINIKSALFFFHMHLLEDQGLVEGAGDRKKLDFGIRLGGKEYLANWPLRLTADGRNFAASLRVPGVMEKIRTSLADAGLSVWVNVAAPLAVDAAKQIAGIS